MATTTTTTTTNTPEAWTAVRDRKRAEQLARIPAEWRIDVDKIPAAAATDLRPVAAASGLLSARELEITGPGHDATSLAAALAAGRYTALETVTAFCKRAAVAQQLCRCLTEICFGEALAKAAQLDAHFAATGQTVGPFHGLPITFKDCFHVTGYDACNGYISRCFVPSTTTTPIIALAEAQGAVLIAKTNVPQTMLVAECDNNVFGHTTNPVVAHLSVGGSSGGEGCLSAFRGHALGIGTDVGGSIRLPAAFTGVYALKPSHGVLPFIGYAPSGWSGVNTGIPAVLGPLAHSVRDLRLFTGGVRAQQPWTFDPAVLPGVLEGTVSSGRKPVVGFLYGSGVTPHPPVRRALQQAQQQLAAAGYATRDFTAACPDFMAIRDVAAALFTADGLSYQRQQLARAGEPAVPSVVDFGYWALPRKTHEEMWALGAQKAALQKQMLDAWQAAGIDVLVAPVAPHAPVPRGKSTLELYTVAWNVMDYPAVIIPYTTVDPELDHKDDSFQPLHALDAEIQALFDPQGMAGAPVSLQIVAPRLHDAALLDYAEALDQVLNLSKLS